MKSFQERMYSQGLILADYEKGKPLCDDIDRISTELTHDFAKLTITQIQSKLRHLANLRKEALSYYARNPLGHPRKIFFNDAN